MSIFNKYISPSELSYYSDTPKILHQIDDGAFSRYIDKISIEDLTEYYQDNNKFSHAFIINMDDCKERLVSSQNILNKLKIKNIRFPAILGKDLENNTTLSSSELGCLKSHLSVIELASKHPNSDGFTMIFEDDITTNINNKTFKQFKKDIEKLDEKDPINLIYFGKCFEMCLEMTKIENNIYYAKAPLCLHAYAIKNSYAKKLLKYIDDNKNIINNPIDIILRDLVDDQKAKAVVFHPSLFYQDVLSFNSSQRSDISNMYNLIECHEIKPKEQNYGHFYVFIIAISIILLFVAILLFWNIKS